MHILAGLFLAANLLFPTSTLQAHSVASMVGPSSITLNSGHYGGLYDTCQGDPECEDPETPPLGGGLDVDFTDAFAQASDFANKLWPVLVVPVGIEVGASILKFITKTVMNAVRAV